MRLVDAGHKAMHALALGVDGHAEVSAPAQYGTHYPTLVLARLAIKRHHDVGTVDDGILGSIHVVHLKHTGLQGFLGNLRFRTPGTMLMGHPCVTLTEGHETTGILLQDDGLLLVVANHGPGLNHITVVVGPVAHIHLKGINFVLQGDGVYRGVGLGLLCIRLVHQFGTHIAIGMLHVKCRYLLAAGTKGRIGLLPKAECIINLTHTGNPFTVIAHMERFALLCLQQECGVGGIHQDVLCKHGHCCHCSQQ